MVTKLAQGRMFKSHCFGHGFSSVWVGRCIPIMCGQTVEGGAKYIYLSLSNSLNF